MMHFPHPGTLTNVHFYMGSFNKRYTNELHLQRICIDCLFKEFNVGK